MYLMRRLKGIPISSLPVLGSTQSTSVSIILPPLTQQYMVVAYADYVELVIISMQEWAMVGTACNRLERADGVQLHRDPRSEKVKVLPVG